MSHSNVGQTNLIGTHESVYRDSPIRNLEGFSVKSILQLQQGFDSNILTCISIGVHDNSALFASEQGIVATVMSLPNSTAVGTVFGCMPRINDIQHDSFVKASLFKVLPESEERNTHDFSVESFTFRRESFEILNGNVSIISQSHFGNIPYNFTYPVLHKIMLISFSPIECFYRISASSIGMTLKNGLSFKELLPANPDALSKVILMQDISFRRDNRDSKAFAVYINSKNILPLRKFNFLFGKIRNNLKSRSQSIGLAAPSRFQKVGIPLEVTVLDYRNSNAVSWINAKFNKRHSHVKDFAVARNIEFDSNPFSLALASPNSTFQRGIYLNIEASSLFGFGKGLPMKIHEFIAEIPFFPEAIEFGSCLQREFFENVSFRNSYAINLQKYSTFHFINRTYLATRSYNTCTRQFIPPLKSVGFLVEIR